MKEKLKKNRSDIKKDIIISLENEKWKIVEGYENYKISTYGRIMNIITNNLLKPTKTENGYMQINLCKFKKYKGMRIHRLVAGAFIPNPSNYPEVNHKDGNKSNNKVENLEFVTYSENTLHAHRNNLIKAGGHGSTIDQIDIDTGKIINTFESIKKASEYLKMTRGKFRRIYEKKISYNEFKWIKHIDKDLYGEIWKTIKSYKNYKISNLGRIKNKNNELLHPSGLIYKMIGLQKNKKSKKYCIHKLVAGAFIPNPDNKKEVNHIDHNKHNNKLSNLEWVTHRENIVAAVIFGNIKSRKIAQYDLDDNLIKIWRSKSYASKTLNISSLSLWYVLRGKVSHLGKYKWKYYEE